MKMPRRVRDLKRRYGMTHSDYERLLAGQRHACPICGRSLTGKTPRGYHHPIDHDHDTERVRGVLCHPCNTHLGWLERNLGAVSAYLERGKIR